MPRVVLPKEVEERIHKLGEELGQIEKRRKEIRAELTEICAEHKITIRFKWRKRFSLSKYALSHS